MNGATTRTVSWCNVSNVNTPSVSSVVSCWAIGSLRSSGDTLSELHTKLISILALRWRGRPAKERYQDSNLCHFYYHWYHQRKELVVTSLLFSHLLLLWEDVRQDEQQFPKQMYKKLLKIIYIHLIMHIPACPSVQNQNLMTLAVQCELEVWPNLQFQTLEHSL